MANYINSSANSVNWNSVLDQVKIMRVGGLDERNEWTSVCASLYSAYNANEADEATMFEIFHTLSMNSANYKSEKDCQSVWRSWRGVRSYTPGTAIDFLVKQGVKPYDNNGKNQPLRVISKIKPQKPVQYYYPKESDDEFARTTNIGAIKASRLIGFVRRLFFGWEYYHTTKDVISDYRVGFDAQNGFELFRYYDDTGILCKIKRCKYDKTGHRLRTQGALYTTKADNGTELRKCFFGQHLLHVRSSAPVCIVESEKTAIIMAILKPEKVWLATGGKDMLNNLANLDCLKGRSVTLFPDIDAIKDWQRIADINGFGVASECIEWYKDNEAKGDIADQFIKQIENTNEAEPMKSQRSKLIEFCKNNEFLGECIMNGKLFIAD